MLERIRYMVVNDAFIDEMTPYTLYYVILNGKVSCIVHVYYKGFSSLFRMTLKTFIRFFTKTDDDSTSHMLKKSGNHITLWLNDGVVGSIPEHAFTRALLSGMKLTETSHGGVKVYKTIDSMPFIVECVNNGGIYVCGEYETSTTLVLPNLKDVWYKTYDASYDSQKLINLRTRYSKRMFKFMAWLYL